jgi:hypothetical protein
MGENQCGPIIEFTFDHLDDFGRKVYKGKCEGFSFTDIYKMVNGIIHYCTKDGEPSAPTAYNYVIIKDYEGVDHTSN